MAKSGLPTRDDLKKLASKDPWAVVWYAYRAALRAVPLLGLTKIEAVWRKGPVAHCFAVIRPLFLLSGGKDIQEYSTASSASSDAASTAARAAARAAAYLSAYDASAYDAYDTRAAAAAAYAAAAYAAASFAASAAASAAAASAASAYDAAAIYAYDASAAYDAAAVYAYDTYDAADAADAADASSADAYAAYAAAAYAACTPDYQVLKRYYQRRTTAFPQKKLWPKGRPDFVAEGEEALLQTLVRLGLDFVAEDLNRLFNNEPLPKERIRAYFEFNLSEAQRNDPEAIRQAILGDVVTQKEVRVLLVGPGGAGKTTLFKRLLGKDPAEHQGGATSGVFIHGDDVTFGQDRFDWLGDRNKALNGLKLKLWDFAGQTIFYGLHLAFLHENCVYVLVVDNRHEQAPDVWLAQIQDLVSGADGLRKIQVLVVTNEYENLYSKQNETRLRREFPHLLDGDCFYYFSCKEQGCRQEQCLRKGNDCRKSASAGEPCTEFQEFIKQLISKANASCYQITKDLDRKRKAVEKEFKKSKILTAKNLKEVFSFQLGEEDSNLEALKSLGVLTKVLLDQQIYCLDNNWLTKKAYRILNHPDVMNNKGMISESNFNNSEDDDLSQLVFRIFLCERGYLISGKDFWYIPNACKSDEPEFIKKWIHNNEKYTFTLRFNLPWFPFGIRTALVSKLFNPDTPEVLTYENIWRDGFVMGDESAAIIVNYQPAKSRIELIFLGPDIAQLGVLFKRFSGSIGTIPSLDRLKRNQGIECYPLFNKNFVKNVAFEGWLKIFDNISDYGEFIERIKKMGKKINYMDNTGATIYGSAVNEQHNNNFEVHPESNGLSTLLEYYKKAESDSLSPEQKVFLDTFLRKTQKGQEEELNDKEKTFSKTIKESLKGTVEIVDNVGKMVETCQKLYPAIKVAVRGALTAIGIGF